MSYRFLARKAEGQTEKACRELKKNNRIPENWKLEIKIVLREDGNVEVISGLNSGDIIVAEGLKKVRPNSKIKPLSK